MSKVKVVRLSISIYPDEHDVVQAVIRTVPGVRTTSAAIQHIIWDYNRRHEVVSTPAPATTAQEPKA